MCFVDEKRQVKAFAQPSQETLSAFNAFASANGLKPTGISPNGDWVSITLPVSQANTLFAAQFEVTTFTVVSVDGGLSGLSTQGDPETGEAALDIELEMTPTRLYDHVPRRPPTVLSTSYGDTESIVESSLATKICNGYMALGSRGVSGGVRRNHDTPDLCNNNPFIPVFPASCPFVTTVGATIGFRPEVAVNFTGGGFSKVFPTPAYQTAAVAGFPDTLPSDFAGTFNKTGRGYPDVAVQGWNFRYVVEGTPALASGASASTPGFGAILALIIDRLIAAANPFSASSTRSCIRRRQPRSPTSLPATTRALVVPPLRWSGSSTRISHGLRSCRRTRWLSTRRLGGIHSVSVAVS
ncbi:peptidase S8/S53 domain-containing protein [Mycena epipterygia]|nr:peptidase S8/S53 domain-containing protein [Mycena epipterygia]